MGNLIWTAILYFSTFSIVFITFRTFIVDKRAEGERKSVELVSRAEAQRRGRPNDNMMLP